MAKTTFVSIITVDGVVKKIEGDFTNGGLFDDAPTVFINKSLTDMLNKCDKEGYEHFETETIGKTKVYRMKLRQK